jgi:hypothetical protein
MSVPERWQELIDLVLIPIAWVPRLQEALLAYFLAPGPFWGTAAKYVFLAFPALLGVAAVWVTLLSLYTLPFRRYRLRFVSMMLLAWWDAARAVTLYWGGVVRVAAIAVGWVLTLAALGVRLLVDALHRLATTPVGMAGRPPHGVPWIACAVLIAWCVLEAAVFTYATVPTVIRALNGVTGGGEESRFTTGVLYGFLLLLVMGSFACLQVLTDAVRARQVRVMVQMAAVQLLVMVFEVLFLYRPLVDALVPLVAGQAGARIGPWSAMALAALAWGATRTLTWFLFAQHGTAPLLAFLARRQEAEVPTMRAAAPQAWWRPAAADFEREVEWLHRKGEQLTEYVALPVLQLVAAALNFALLVVASRPVFHLPFRAMREVTDTRDLLATLHLIPRKQTSL